MPDESGGYLLLAEFIPGQGKNASPVISRRYIKVGEMDKYIFYDYKPKPLKY